MALLPFVGAEAVILGMAAFNANAKSVNTQLEMMGRSAYNLERTTRGAFSGVEDASNKMAGTIKTAGAIALGVLTAMGAAAVVMGMRYQSNLAFVGAIAEGTTAQISQLNDAQLNLSRHSTTTTSQLNTMASELIKAGFSIESMSGDTLAAVNDMVVASKGELDAARAATLAQVATAAFGATVRDAADAATAAVQRSTITWSGFSDALRQGGGVAAKQGLTIQQFAAVVGTLGQTIQSGSEIGTGFRMMLQRLQAPSEANVALMKKYGISLYDATGAARPFRDVLVSLEQAFGPAAIQAGKLTQAERDQAIASMFGGRAIKTVTALLDEGTAGYDRMAVAVGALKVADVAREVMLPTADMAKIAANNVAALGIAFYQGLDPYINSVTRSTVEWLQSLDIGTIRDFGRTIGRDLYNAFANLGAIVKDVVVPVVRGMLPVAFAYAATVIVTNLAAINTQLGAWLAKQSVAFGMWIASCASAAAAAVTNTALIVANLAKTGIALVAATGQWLLYASTVITVYGSNLLSAVVSTTASIVASLMSQVVALATLVGAWVAARATVLAELAVYSAGVIGTFLLANAQMAGHGAAALAAAAGVAAAWVATAMPGLFTYLGGLVKVTVAAVVQFATMKAAAISSAIATAYAWLSVALPSMISAIGGMLAAAAPLLLGIAAIGTAVGLMAVAWSDNWFDIQGVVGKAISWILEKLNGFLDALSSLPVIGEAIGGARAAITGFFGNIPKYAVAAKNAVSGFVDQSIAGFQAMKNIQIPPMKDYAAELEAITQAANDARDASRLGIPTQTPHVPVDLGEEGAGPGSYPDTGAAGRAAKKSAEDIKNAIAKSEELIRDFNDAIDKETEKTANDIANLYTKAFAELEAAAAKAATDTAKAYEDANKKIAEANSERAIREDAARRRKVLDDELEQETIDRQKNLDKIEAGHQRELEDTKKIADDKRQARKDALDKELEDAAAKRARDREDEDRTYDKSLEKRKEVLKKQQDLDDDTLKRNQDRRERDLQLRQDAEEAALKKRHDAEELALKNDLDTLKVNLKARQDAEDEALKKSQEARDAALEERQRAEKNAYEDAKTTAEIETELARDKQKAQDAYEASIKKGVKESIARATLEKAVAAAEAQAADKRQGLVDRQAERSADEAFSKKQEAEQQALQAQFDKEQKAQAEAQRTALDKLDEEADAKRLALKVKQDEESLKLDQQHEQQRLDLKRAFEEEATKLHAEQETARRNLDDQLEKDALQRSRTRQDQDTQYKREQEKARRDLEVQLQGESLLEQRNQEDAERQRKYGLDTAEREFRKKQDEARAALTKQLDDEEHQRRLDNITTERDERIKAVEQTLAEEQEKTRTKLAQDIVDLRTNLQERLDAIRTQYFDKLQDLLKVSEEVMKPIVDEITGNIIKGLEGIRDAAKEATEQLAAAFAAAEKLKAAQNARDAAASRSQIGGRDWATYNFELNMGATPEQAAAKADKKQYGGVVPGPFGSQQLIVAHGGERYEGIGSHNNTLAAVRASESLALRGMGGSTYVTNNYSYQVDANYGRVQPEGSVARDLSALVALTRR